MWSNPRLVDEDSESFRLIYTVGLTPNTPYYFEIVFSIENLLAVGHIADAFTFF